MLDRVWMAGSSPAMTLEGVVFLGPGSPLRFGRDDSSFLRPETPAFRPGRKRILSLRADVFGDDGQRSAAARGGEVGRGPQHAVVVATRHFGPGFSQPAARYALQAVDELGEGDLGRMAH